MVRPADLRKRKYEGKVDPETLAIQTRALKPLMVRGETLYFPAIATVEEKVKRLVEGEGVPTIQVRDYLNFGREMYELTKKFSGSTLAGEAQIRVNKWSDRGLTGSLLVRIANLFGVTPKALPGPPSILDLINEGYFPLMIGKTMPTISHKFYEEGTGLETFEDFEWRIYADPLNEYYLERRFFWVFRKIHVYLTKLRFQLSRSRKDNVCFCECAWSIEKQVGEGFEVPFFVALFNDDIPEGCSDYSYTFDPPIEIPLASVFDMRTYLGVWSESPVFSSELRVRLCFLESKLVV